jgi:biopolymer transport protein ExbB
MLEVYSEFANQLSATLMVLIGMSVLALGVGIERVVFTLRFRKRLRQGRDSILTQLRAGDLKMAEAVNVSLPWHPATSLFEMIIKSTNVSVNEVKRAQGRVVRAAKRRLWILGSIGSVAPFVGLLGTVIGVMEAFHAIGAQGAGGFQVVSAGISEALITTAAGIFVGVEAVVLFNYLQVCVSEYAVELKESVEEINESAAGGPSAVPSA